MQGAMARSQTAVFPIANNSVKQDGTVRHYEGCMDRGDFQGGSGGGAPLLKFFIILGASAPPKILALALLSKYFLLLCYALLCGY